MRKKGSIFDILYSIILVVLVGIVVIVVGKVFGEVSDNFQDTDLKNDSKAIISERESNFSPVWDTVLLFITLGLSFSVIVLSFMIRSHPAFYFIMLFVMIIYIILAGVLNNVYEGFTENAQLEDEAAEYSMFNLIGSELPIYATILSLIVAVVIFSKGET